MEAKRKRPRKRRRARRVSEAWRGDSAGHRKAAEYVAQRGNSEIILCERGIRTFETYTRNTLDISAIPVVQKLSHLPVLVDPSHATGLRDLVIPMSLAAAAAGADGLLVEVHPHPEEALSDGFQALTPALFRELMARLTPVLAAVGRRLATSGRF
jgi:3-deoxy-7-phosphoheptulonate synthase